MRTLAILLFVPLLCTCVRAQRMLPVDSMGVMAEEIYQLIKDRHPAAFQPEGLAALEAARAQVLREITKAMMAPQDSTSYHEFVRLVSPLQQATQCGHLILEPYRDAQTYLSARENHFDLLMMPVDSGNHYMLAQGVRTRTDSIGPGTFIRSVNGRPTRVLIEQVSRFGGANDRGNDYASKALSARAFSLRYQQYYGLQDSLILEVDGSEGTSEQHVISPKNRPSKKRRLRGRDIDKVLQFRLSDDATTGILTIKSFSPRKLNNGIYYKYIRGVMKSLQRDNIRNLVIDLRTNTGGSVEMMSYLFSLLAKEKFQLNQRAEFTGPTHAVAGEPEEVRKRRQAGAVYPQQQKLQELFIRELEPSKKRYRYRGRVIVLIDELTFSASGTFARLVQGSGRGILVGTTAGASANVYYGTWVDDDQNFFGPQNDFRLRISGILLELPDPVPGNVTPDITVTPTPKGLREGKDEIMDVALEVLQGEG